MQVYTVMTTYTNTYTLLHIHTNTHTHTDSLHAHRQTDTYTHTHTHTYIVYTRTHLCVHLYLIAYTNIHTPIPSYIHTHISIHLYLLTKVMYMFISLLRYFRFSSKKKFSITERYNKSLSPMSVII